MATIAMRAVRDGEVPYDGGNEPSPEGVEPDTKDIGAPPER